MQPNPMNQPQVFPAGGRSSKAAAFATAFSDFVRSFVVVLSRLLIALAALSVFMVCVYALWFGANTVLRALGAY